jgi:two-component system, OmpR family, sensor histidine kinase KdpD
VNARAVKRGQLHVYLGAAPGVGKTFAMLSEGRRLRAEGEDVVVGLVETHDRADLGELLDGMEIVPKRRLEYRGTAFDELDLDAILDRRPQVVLVDELAHTNAPGTYHDKRWQDVATLLERGVDVVSTLNVQHLEGMSLAVEAITGKEQRETVPDRVVAAAARVDLVDAPTVVLCERLAAGRIYSPGRSSLARDASLHPERVDALRALADRWLAEHRPRFAPGFGGSRRGGAVVAALTGTPEGERVVRRAAELAAVRDSVLIGVHVREPSGLLEVQPAWLDRQRRLLADCGGSYVESPASMWRRR